MNNKPQTKLSLDKSLMAAALLLPLIAAPAHAETAPEKTTIAYKYLDYLDSQPGVDRIGVKAHALLLTKPINDEWSFTATTVNDVVSGASPKNHTQRLTKLYDVRDAYSLGVTRYLPTGTATVTGSYSTESDYVSRSVSATGVWFTNDTKNTALTAGVGLTRDDINPSNRIVVGERKSINDLMLGVTQVFSPVDIVQVNLRHSRGKGYYTDPYKDKDKRPTERNASTLLTRWNHHFQSVDGSLRTSYRYYSDSFKIKAHTIGLEYAQAAGHGWTLTPLVRLHSQNAAWFYSPYDPAGRFGMSRPDDGPYTTDQRMAAYGALTTGLKVARQITPDLVVDVKFEKYRQYGTWAISGQGDSGLASFKARSVQVGLSYQF